MWNHWNIDYMRKAENELWTAISKTRSTEHTKHTEHTEHGAHEVRSSRETKILYNKIHCLLLQIFVIINKDFSRFTRWGSKKIGLLKNTYAKLPKAIVVFKIGLWNSLSYIYQAYVVMFIIYSLYYIILYSDGQRIKKHLENSRYISLPLQKNSQVLIFQCSGSTEL